MQRDLRLLKNLWAYIFHMLNVFYISPGPKVNLN